MKNPQDKIFFEAERRQATWKPFGNALDSNNNEVTQIGEEIKLILRYPNKSYHKEDAIENNQKALDAAWKFVEAENKKKKRIIIESPTNNGNYRPPSRRITKNNIQDKLDESERMCIAVVTELNGVSSDILHEMFGKFGTITRLHSIFHDHSDNVRIAFVHYEDIEQANSAISNMHRYPLNSMLICVEHAKTKKNN